MKRQVDPLIKGLLDGDLTLADLPVELRAEGARALRLLAAIDRTPVQLSPALEQQVMARVRRHAGSPLGRAWTWLMGVREVDLRLRVRPWAIAVGAAAVIALVVARPRGHDATRVADRSPVYVRFVLFAPGAHRVGLAGTFNHWDPQAAALAPAETPGFWTITVSLPPGQHQYAFLVDGSRWVTDPAAPALDDGFGRRNSVLAVTADGSGSRAL